MLYRFKKTRDASIEKIFAGEKKSNVETFDEIDIIIFELKDNSWKIIFRDVCYTFNFMTNIAVTGKFHVKGIYFDDQRMRLHVNERTLGWMRHMHDHDVLKDNSLVYTSQEIIVESIETSH